MCNSNQSGNLLVDKIELQAQLLRNKIAGIIQAAEMDVPSQLHDECLMTDEEQLRLLHYEKAKTTINREKLWSAVEKEILTELDVYLQGSWLKYLSTLLKVDETTAFLLYKDLQRKEDERQDECLKLGFYDYMLRAQYIQLPLLIC